MLSKIFHGPDKRKVKVFSLFLLCSFLAWLISNLSEQYESRIHVSLNYVQLPDSLLLGKNAQDDIQAKIRASGFHFLYYNFFRKRIDVDVSQIGYLDGDYVLTKEELEKQMDQQLSQRISLIELDRERLAVDLYAMDSKELPVRANLKLQLQQNHMLEGEIEIEPAQVLAKGPGKELESLEELVTAFLELNDVSSDFSRELPLVFPKGLDNSVFSANKVTLSGKVAKFSEKVFEVPVKVLNIPEGYQVQTFPNSVSLICKAGVDRLKEISQSDFEVVADYAQLKSPGNSTLVVKIERHPEDVYDVRLKQGNTINFVLKQP